MNIALVDYGMGNMHSIGKALERVGGRVRPAPGPEDVERADAIVLPGVGGFGDCARTLNERGLAEAIVARIREGVPFLGICLGMQILMDASFEFGEHRGFGLIPGRVIRFPEDFPARGFKIPHMGWNDARALEPAHPVLATLNGRQVYYVHSYHCVPEEPRHLLAECDYGGLRFAAAVGCDNILGVQFHPEKSQRAGLALLEAFVRWKP